MLFFIKNMGHESQACFHRQSMPLYLLTVDPDTGFSMPKLASERSCTPEIAERLGLRGWPALPCGTRLPLRACKRIGI